MQALVSTVSVLQTHQHLGKIHTEILVYPSAGTKHSVTSFSTQLFQYPSHESLMRWRHYLLTVKSSCTAFCILTVSLHKTFN